MCNVLWTNPGKLWLSSLIAAPSCILFLSGFSRCLSHVLRPSSSNSSLRTLITLFPSWMYPFPWPCFVLGPELQADTFLKERCAWHHLPTRRKFLHFWNWICPSSAYLWISLISSQMDSPPRMFSLLSVIWSTTAYYILSGRRISVCSPYQIAKTCLLLLYSLFLILNVFVHCYWKHVVLGLMFLCIFSGFIDSLLYWVWEI